MEKYKEFRVFVAICAMDSAILVGTTGNIVAGVLSNLLLYGIMRCAWLVRAGRNRRNIFNDKKNATEEGSRWYRVQDA